MEMGEDDKIIRTPGASLWIKVSPEEEAYRKKYLPDPKKLTDEKLVCTVCSIALAHDVHKGKDIFVHRALQVLVCEACYNFYGDGCFSTDEDGDDKYCRWCGQGGTLYLCSACNCAFCQKCTKQNLKASVIAELENDDWKCYICNPRPLFGCRTICWGAQQLNKIGKEKEQERLKKVKERLEKLEAKKKEANERKSRKNSSSEDEAPSKKRKRSSDEDSSSPEVMPKRRKRESRGKLESRNLNGIGRRKNESSSDSDSKEDKKAKRSSRTSSRKEKVVQSSSEDESDRKSIKDKQKKKKKQRKDDTDESNDAGKKKSRRRSVKKKVSSDDSSEDEKSKKKNKSAKTREDSSDSSSNDRKNKKKPKKKKNHSSSDGSSSDTKKKTKKSSKKKAKSSSDESSEDDVSSKSPKKKEEKSGKGSEKKSRETVDTDIETKKNKTAATDSEEANSAEDILVKKRIKLAILWLTTIVKDISDLGSLISLRAAKFSKKKINTENLNSYEDVLNCVSKIKQLISGVHSNYDHIEKTLESHLKPWKILTGFEDAENDKNIEGEGSMAMDVDVSKSELTTETKKNSKEDQDKEVNGSVDKPQEESVNEDKLHNWTDDSDDQNETRELISKVNESLDKSQIDDQLSEKSEKCVDDKKIEKPKTDTSSNHNGESNAESDLEESKETSKKPHDKSKLKTPEKSNSKVSKDADVDVDVESSRVSEKEESSCNEARSEEKSLHENEEKREEKSKAEAIKEQSKSQGHKEKNHRKSDCGGIVSLNRVSSDEDSELDSFALKLQQKWLSLNTPEDMNLENSAETDSERNDKKVGKIVLNKLEETEEENEIKMTKNVEKEVDKSRENANSRSKRVGKNKKEDKAEDISSDEEREDCKKSTSKRNHRQSSSKCKTVSDNSRCLASSDEEIEEQTKKQNSKSSERKKSKGEQSKSREDKEKKSEMLVLTNKTKKQNSKSSESKKANEEQLKSREDKEQKIENKEEDKNKKEDNAEDISSDEESVSERNDKKVGKIVLNKLEETEEENESKMTKNVEKEVDNSRENANSSSKRVGKNKKEDISSDEERENCKKSTSKTNHRQSSSKCKTVSDNSRCLASSDEEMEEQTKKKNSKPSERKKSKGEQSKSREDKEKKSEILDQTNETKKQNSKSSESKKANEEQLKSREDKQQKRENRLKTKTEVCGSDEESNGVSIMEKSSDKVEEKNKKEKKQKNYSGKEKSSDKLEERNKKDKKQKNNSDDEKIKSTSQKKKLDSKASRSPKSEESNSEEEENSKSKKIKLKESKHSKKKENSENETGKAKVDKKNEKYSSIGLDSSDEEPIDSALIENGAKSDGENSTCDKQENADIQENDKNCLGFNEDVTDCKLELGASSVENSNDVDMVQVKESKPEKEETEGNQINKKDKSVKEDKKFKLIDLDSSSDEEIKVKKSESTKKRPVRNQKKTRNMLALSSDDEQVEKLEEPTHIESSDEEAEKKKEKDEDYSMVISSAESSDSEILPKNKRKKKGSSDSDASISDEDSKKKKKRRRIKCADSSDESEGSGNKMDTSQKSHEGESPTKGGRKNIKKIKKKGDLEQTTIEAAEEEKERRRRIEERQKLFNQVFEVKESAKLEKLVLDFDPETKKEVISVNQDLVAKMKPHQAKGVKFMWDSCFESVKQIKKTKGSGCILAHCMGLGKTFQVISLVHTLLMHEELTKVRTVMVVCPLSTVLNWVNEFGKWLEDIEGGENIEVFHLTKYTKNPDRARELRRWTHNGGVLIMGYEMFRNLTNETTKKFKAKLKKDFLETLIDPGADLIVCDEGHMLKNEATALSKAMTRVKTLRRIVLTGTPMQNNLKEYHCMVQFVKPNLLGTSKEFLNRFVNPINNGQFVDSTDHDVKLMKRRAHVLHTMLEGLVQRFDYNVLTPFLPPKQEYVISVCLSELQEKLYSYYLENESQKAEGMKGGTRLFMDWQTLGRVWTHPRVLKMSTDKANWLKEKKAMEASDSEGSLRDFIDDDTDKSTTTEESTDENSSDESGKKKKKPVHKSRSTRSTRQSGNVALLESSDEEKDKETGEEVTEDKGEWWSSFIEPQHFEDMRQSGKLLLLFAILKECELIEDKVLVFSQSLFSLDLIEYFLDKIDEATQEGRLDENLDNHQGTWSKGLDYFRLDGSTSSENRNIWCKAFNREDNPRARLFLISTRAGGLGINLTAANRVIIFDASWNPSHDIQSIFRIYRFGQKKPCYVYRFVAFGTMEEKVYERQVAKQSISNRVVDEQQVHRHFSMNDLTELYTFTPASKLEDRPTPALPRDPLMTEILSQMKQWIEKYHEHDSLLENVVEEELNEEERKAAWEDYENDKKRGFLPPAGPQGPAMNPNTAWNQQIEIMRQQLKLRYADKSDDEINSILVYQVSILMRQQQQQQQQMAAQMQAANNMNYRPQMYGNSMMGQMGGFNQRGQIQTTPYLRNIAPKPSSQQSNYAEQVFRMQQQANLARLQMQQMAQQQKQQMAQQQKTKAQQSNVLQSLLGQQLSDTYPTANISGAFNARAAAELQKMKQNYQASRTTNPGVTITEIFDDKPSGSSES